MTEPDPGVVSYEPWNLARAFAHLAGAGLGHRGAQVEQLGPIGPKLLGRFACDSVMQRVLLAPNGAVLDLGRDSRTVSRAQRRALNARDRGCVVPGCGAPPEWCEAHHVTYWRDRGLTNIGGLALVCGHDHTLVHQGVWELIMIDGVPWARPPRWIDPLQRLIRNTLHERADQARGLGIQIRLTLPTGPEPDPPWAQPENNQPPDRRPGGPATTHPVDGGEGPADEPPLPDTG